MFLTRIKLKHFRNYNQLDLPLTKQMTLIHGQNAQGKTNILESVLVAATSKSHRTNYYKEMIQFGQKTAHITLYLKKEVTEHRIDVHLEANRKVVLLDRRPLRKMKELLGVLHVIMFSPEDLDLVKRGPAERRRFIDSELSQLDPLYYHYLYQYHLVLRQRNRLLKNISKRQADKKELIVWDEQLIHYGRKVMALRETFINQLIPIFKERHNNIAQSNDNLTIVYQHINDKDYIKKMEQVQERDIYQGTTTYGPHRDDLTILLNDMDIRTYGSQGQQRTVALALKLSEIEIIEKIKKEKPILLLDDVLSELDGYRRQALISHFQKVQTLISCTETEDIIDDIKQSVDQFKVVAGQII